MYRYKVTIEMVCSSLPMALENWVRTAIEDNLNPDYDELPEEKVLSVNIESIEE